MRQQRVSRAFAHAAMCLSAWCMPMMMAACGPKPEPVKPPPPSDAELRPADFDHRITYSGETLAMIASWYTGRASNWSILRDANPGLKPGRLKPGQHVMIPGGLVVRRDPMPKRLITDAARKKPAPTKPADGAPVPPPSGDAPLTPPPSNPPAHPLGDSGVAPAPFGGADDLLAPPPPKDPSPGKNPPAHGSKGDPVGGNLPGTGVETAPPPVEPVAPPEKPAPPAADKERERLLDELLTQ